MCVGGARRRNHITVLCAVVGFDQKTTVGGEPIPVHPPSAVRTHLSSDRDLRIGLVQVLRIPGFDGSIVVGFAGGRHGSLSKGLTANGCTDREP